MSRSVKLALTMFAVFVAAATACSHNNQSPSAPTATGSPTADAAADGSTLKAPPPVPVSPINGATANDLNPVLTVTATQTRTGRAVQYEFEVFNESNAKVAGGVSGSTSFRVPNQLEFGKRHTWHARGTLEGAFSSWSALATFVSLSDGYIHGNEIYDPLTKGKTVGTVHGPVTWIPDVGVRMDDPESWIEYELPQFLSAGEYSALVSGLTVVSANEDPKWRVLSMREGRSAMNDNEFRMTIDKRGNGAIAWRFITGNAGSGQYIETSGAERVTYRFQDHLTYLVRGSWGGGFFRVQYKEGGADGALIYDFGKPYAREYTPVPHMVYVGSPWIPGERGEPSTVDGMIVRQVWVSPNPRPAFANK